MYYIPILISKLLKQLTNVIFFNKELRNEYREKINKVFSPIALELLKKEISNKYKDYWIFVPFWPWGDFIIGCSLLKEFKKEYGGKILIFYKNANQLEFIKALNIADKITKLPREIYYSTCTNSITEIHNENGLRKGEMYELSHHVFKDAENQKSNNFTELYAKMLHLKNIKLAIPKFSPQVVENVNKLYNEISNGKKVIMLSPHANSYDEREISYHYWRKIGKYLEAQGYKVVINTNRKFFEEFENVYLPLPEQCYFSTLCYGNISLRSGFTDLITICGANNQIVLYPESMRFITITREHQLEEMNRIFNIRNDLSFEDNMFYWTSINTMYHKNFKEEIIKYAQNEKELIS